MVKWKKILTLIIVCILAFNLTGCASKEQEVKKIKDLDFTVVENEDLPEELKTIIEEKKKEPFKLSFSNKEYLYIAQGYGKQPTGGYSITVDELYLTANTINVHTTLLGPDKNEDVEKAETFPYIVIKIKMMDKNVVFE